MGFRWKNEILVISLNFIVSNFFFTVDEHYEVRIRVMNVNKGVLSQRHPKHLTFGLGKTVSFS